MWCVSRVTFNKKSSILFSVLILCSVDVQILVIGDFSLDNPFTWNIVSHLLCEC